MLAHVGICISMAWKKIQTKKSHRHEASPVYCQGEAMTIWKSLGSDFWSQNSKSMWKPYAVDISYFIRKNFLLLIFQTLFTENWSIYDNFDTDLNLVESIISIYRKRVKINFECDFGPFFVSNLSLFDLKQVWVKIVLNWPIFSK